jgi:hypothetical protein
LLERNAVFAKVCTQLSANVLFTKNRTFINLSFSKYKIKNIVDVRVISYAPRSLSRWVVSVYAVRIESVVVSKVPNNGSPINRNAIAINYSNVGGFVAGQCLCGNPLSCGYGKWAAKYYHHNGR